MLSPRILLLLLLLPPLLFAGAASAAAPPAARPNFVIFFGDDWGWGDLGENMEEVRGLTDNLDKLAAGGVRFTDFHVGASVCTPSRAALMTGRIGLRTGVVKNFGPSSLHGLPTNETTIAEMLKPHGYRTGMIGKWHLGTAHGYHPSDRGFDSYLGVPYSIDMGCGGTPTSTMAPLNDEHTEYCPACQKNGEPAPACPADPACGRRNGCADFNIGVPVFHNRTILEQPADLDALSAQYDAEAARFIAASAASGDPFFLYFAASHVHVPQNHAKAAEGRLPDTPYANRANGGRDYAAALLEMDDHVGAIVTALGAAGAADRTLILVTGDNGNWECKCNLTGTPGPYQGLWQKDHGGGSSAKCTVWEGGHREVGIAYWPGTVRPAVSDALASSMDFLPTIAALSGAPLPGGGRHFDGVDLSPVLLRGAAAAHATLFHPACACAAGEIDAARNGTLKAVWRTGGVPGCGGAHQGCTKHATPLVFDLAADPAERSPLDAGSADVAALAAGFEQLRSDYLADIAAGVVSVTKYDSGAAGKAVNCCNATNAACACHA